MCSFVFFGRAFFLFRHYSSSVTIREQILFSKRLSIDRSFSKVSSIVSGALNTDFFVSGISHFPAADEEILGSRVRISAGGKSRNIAEMISRLLGQQSVAMVGKTTRDPYGLWKVPINALNEAGVDTQFVKVIDQKNDILPGITFIPVTMTGEHQIFYLPGVTQLFSPQDVYDASSLFAVVGACHGSLCVALEHRLDTVLAALELAQKYQLRSYIDTGGVQVGKDYSQVFSANIELVKPNLKEAYELSGVRVVDVATAVKAANFFFQYGVRNVLITAGSLGGYLVNQNQCEHIPIPNGCGQTKGDSVGCGDQVMAALIAYSGMGFSLREAAKISILAGSLQFCHEGVFPIDQGEIERYI